MPRRVPLIATAATAAFGIVFGCAAPPPPSGWFGNLYLGGSRSFDANKVFVVSYRLSDGPAQVADVTVAYGAPSKLPPARRDYLVELVGADGRALSSRPAADPRRAIVEKEGNVILSSALLSVRFGFQRAAVKARLSDDLGRTVATADLARAIDAFCERNSNDPDCRAISAARRPTDEGRTDPP